MGDHFLDLFLAHGPPQKVSLAQRIAGDLLRHPHDLFLVDRHAVRGFQNRFQVRVLVANVLGILLTGDIGRNVIHWTRPVERDNRNHVFKIARTHLAQRVAHTLAFQLEDTQRIAAGHQVISGLIIERVPFRADITPIAANEFQRAINDGQRLQPQEVELHETCRLGPFHVELRRRKVGPRVIVKRHELCQGPVTNHDTRRVRTRVPIEPLKRQRCFQQFAHPRVLCDLVLELRFLVDRFLQFRRIGRIERDELCQTVDLAIRHLHDAAHIPHHSLCLQCTEGNDRSHTIGAVLVAHIADDLAAPLLTEVDIEVGHRDPFRVQEALKEKVKPKRIKVRNRQNPGNNRTRTGTTAWPDRDVIILRPFDKVGNDQEVAGKAHLLDNAQLIFEPFFVHTALSIQFGCFGQAFVETFTRLQFKFINLGARAIAEIRQDRAALRRAYTTALGDLDS